MLQILMYILPFIPLSKGDDHTCNSLMSSVVRNCEPVILEDQSQVYFDFTTFNGSSSRFCTCSLNAKPGTRMRFLSQHALSPQSKPDGICVVNILSEDQTFYSSRTLACCSINFTMVLQTTVISLTVYSESFTARDAEFSCSCCYSVFSDDNTLFDVVCAGTPTTTPLPTKNSPQIVTFQDVFISNSSFPTDPTTLKDTSSWLIVLSVAGGTILTTAFFVPIIIHFRKKKADVKRTDQDIHYVNTTVTPKEDIDQRITYTELMDRPESNQQYTNLDLYEKV